MSHNNTNNFSRRQSQSELLGIIMEEEPKSSSPGSNGPDDSNNGSNNGGNNGNDARLQSLHQRIDNITTNLEGAMKQRTGGALSEHQADVLHNIHRCGLTDRHADLLNMMMNIEDENGNNNNTTTNYQPSPSSSPLSVSKQRPTLMERQAESNLLDIFDGAQEVMSSPRQQHQQQQQHRDTAADNNQRRSSDDDNRQSSDSNSSFVCIDDDNVSKNKRRSTIGDTSVHSYLSTDSYLSDKADMEELASRACALASSRPSMVSSIDDEEGQRLNPMDESARRNSDAMDLAVYDDEVAIHDIEGVNYKDYYSTTDNNGNHHGPIIHHLPLTRALAHRIPDAQFEEIYYSEDDDDDDDDDEYIEEVEESDDSLAMAARTSQIMSTFRDYLSDIDGSGQAQAQEKSVPTETAEDVEDREQGRYMKRFSDGHLTSINLNQKQGSNRQQERGSEGDLVAGIISTYLKGDKNEDMRTSAKREVMVAGGGGSDATILREWNLHDLALDDTIDSLEEGNGSGRKKVRYTHPILHSKRWKKVLIIILLGVLLVCVLCVMFVSLGNHHGESGGGTGSMTHEETMIHGEPLSNDYHAEEGAGSVPQEETMMHEQPIEKESGGVSAKEPSGAQDSKETHHVVQEPGKAVTNPQESPAESIIEETLSHSPSSNHQDQSNTEDGPGVSIQEYEQTAVANNDGFYTAQDSYENSQQNTGFDTVESSSSQVAVEVTDTAGSDGATSIEAKYQPKWYERSNSDWLGRSYIDAIAFCASQDATIPCPYEAICPNGPGSIPTGGTRPQLDTSNVAVMWAPIMDIPNGWIAVGDSANNAEGIEPCTQYNAVHSTPPAWGLTKHGYNNPHPGEVDHSPHIMCCKPPLNGEINSSEHVVQSSRHDLDDDPNKPEEIDNTSQGEVAVTTKTDESSVVAATDKNEQEILDKLHPVWFGRKHGYHGTTYKEAYDFCKSVGDYHLCPREAYCPDGLGKINPLFLQKPAFEGEQWAPVSSTIVTSEGLTHEVGIGIDIEKHDPAEDNSWVLVGTINGLSWSTCMAYDQINHEDGGKPSWGVDGTQPELKENILCCQNPNNLLKEQNFAQQLDPIWLDESHGWNGGSHSDAMEFCGTLGRRKLCPYTVYCPHGPGHPVIGGHIADFNTAGEQWAPAHSTSSEASHWVMIGQKYENSATTCMDNWGLLGGEPSWGLTEERPELKKNIMCCTF